MFTQRNITRITGVSYHNETTPGACMINHFHVQQVEW